MTEELKLHDPRVEFIAMFLLKSFKSKSDKWIKMYAFDDNKQLITDFLDRYEPIMILFYLNTVGLLTILTSFPTQIKGKMVYFIKRIKGAVGKDGIFLNEVLYGDLSQSPIDQISAIMDGVLSFFQF